jgi:hypothetical protein
VSTEEAFSSINQRRFICLNVFDFLGIFMLNTSGYRGISVEYLRGKFRGKSVTAKTGPAEPGSQSQNWTATGDSQNMIPRKRQTGEHSRSRTGAKTKE